MKILTLSDLCWDRKLRNIKSKIVDCFVKEDLERKKYKGINKYFKLIEKEKPDLVLFAGDITGDGSCGHGFQNAFKILLKLLEINKIQSFFIRGNHDEIDYYNEVIKFTKKLKFTKDISNKLTKYKRRYILGIPFDKSNKKSEFKEFINCNKKKKIDIVLSHAELKRRTWLFDLKSDFIITGHFDKKLTIIENKIFISLDNDSSKISYCTIQYFKNRNAEIKYFIQDEKNELTYTTDLDNLRQNNLNNNYKENGETKNILIEEKKLSFIEFSDKYEDKDNFDELWNNFIHPNNDLKFLRGFNYKKAINRIREIKNKNKLLSEKEFTDLVNLKIEEFYNVTKSIIIDYTGINYKK